MPSSQALWITAPRTAELRTTELRGSSAWLEIETLFSGISRGTESLVFDGRVPEVEWQRMRCPLQEGAFSFPVKYGYAAVGKVVAGDGVPLGGTVFVLHPHQERFLAPFDMVVSLPSGVPAGRAVLAANMETALNVVWDAHVGPGDRIAVIGAGVVGALAAWLCAQIPATEVTLVDINSTRHALAEALGCRFARPQNCPKECDVVVHASASSSGLETALSAAATEARVVEASWYGSKAVRVQLGGAFHSRRLQIVSSQVGEVPPDRRMRWSRRRRLEAALALLADPRLDALISGETEFSELAERYGAILADSATLCHRVRYPAAE